MSQSSDVLIAARAVRTRLGNISTMTLHRWVQAKVLPPPVKINGRNYWPESEVAALQQQRGQQQKQEAA